MKKYTINVGGRGADCYIHKLTEDQKVKLDEGGVVQDEMTIDQVLEILDEDFITNTDTVILGVYFEDDLYHITVTDENENDVWESNNNLVIFDEDEDYTIIHNEPNLLICEDFLKGNFFNYKLEIENDFDSTKLTAIVEEVGEYIPLITGFRYDGKKLEVDEYGDYWDKGFNFYLT